MKNNLFTKPSQMREFSILEYILAGIIAAMLLWFVKKEDDTITLDKNTKVIVITSNCTGDEPDIVESADSEDLLEGAEIDKAIEAEELKQLKQTTKDKSIGI